MAEQDLIFVSIASYRDSQLVPTITDCLAKAARPERLRFGVCWQHGEDEKTLPFIGDGRFHILDVDWRESRGACWARAAIMQLWAGEAWFLQVDSHCRFAPGWDELLIQTAAQTGSPKPILSTYPPPFTPGEHEVLGGEPVQIAFQGFNADGIPYMKPVAIPGFQHRSAPVRARFVAAGFLFAPGSFVEEVPYDPELYFIGEEATLALRAFTAGYDLFHPCVNVVWHDYVRTYAVRHWDDHTDEARSTWNVLDRLSKERVRRLFAGEPLGKYGLGAARTLAEYEAYAGLSFRLFKGQNDTLLAKEPPNASAPSGWADEVYTWMARIGIDRAVLPAQALDDPAFWYVAVLDAEGNEIFRRDFPGAELLTLKGDEPIITLVVEFVAGIIPAGWSVWPVSQSRGWLERIKGVLAEDDFSVILEDDSGTETAVN